MHLYLDEVRKRIQRAHETCESNRARLVELFGAEHPYCLCYLRLGNKARYALEVISFYGERFPDDGELAEEYIERITETEKWYLIGILSVIEYSMPCLLGDKGSEKLRDLARNGPFGNFLKIALAEGYIDTNDKSAFEFLARVRNDLIHRNAVSRESAALDCEGWRTFTLTKDEMMEGYSGMLADLGALAILAATGFMLTVDSRHEK